MADQSSNPSGMKCDGSLVGNKLDADSMYMCCYGDKKDCY